ncbi:MAG TPA: SRPBCC family protein [Bryobacteraceae bacterium]|nr:SRPBCC family protein [Bryobacteraceae bacterium]
MEVLKTKPDTNVSEPERWASIAGGITLAAWGLSRRNNTGLGLAALGGALAWRGYTGHCPFYQALGVNTACRGRMRGTGTHASVPYELGIRVDQSMHIQKPAEELYRFWRKLDNLPKFMKHLTRVEMLDDRRSHWVACGPAGMDVEWDAEIIHEEENRRIGWRSLEGSDVDNAGSVRFEPQPGGGTIVHVSLQYNPPAGLLGEAVARLFGENPKKQIREDLQRFKELMERGSIRNAKKERVEEPQLVGARKMWDRDKVLDASEESFPASDPPSWNPSAI